ncbi:Ig-like domain-containing protein [Microcella pacifica]
MLTTVGERLVIASTTGSGTRISVVGGGSTDLPPGPIRLQQPGVEADAVVVASADTLLAVPLGGGDPRSLGGPAPAPAAAPSEIAAPAVVDDCVYGAWAASAHYVRACDDGDVQTEALVGVSSADELVFRINRSSVVLNSVASGVVWLVQDDMTVIEAEDWLAVAPPEEDDEAPESDESTTQPSFDEILAERPETNTPPEAKNDDFGMRAGRATVLPVLENDIDLDGDVLTIASVTGLSPDVAQLDIIDGGRALQITPVSDAAVTRTFGYTVTDGRPGGTAQAVVTVTVAPEEQNRAPEAQRVSQLSLEAGGTISYNVLADWRDPDGDDLYLTSAASTAGDSVRFSPDGLVTLAHSGTEPGERTIVFTVSDGSLETSEQPQGELRVSIEPGGSLPPLTVPDFGRAFTGQDVVLDPISNDVSRSTRDISLLSVEALTPGANFTAVPDSDEYRFGASDPGSYYFVYAASTGASTESKGILRLDVLPDPEEVQPPIAVKDTAFLRPGEPLTVPVLLNDVSPSGAVIGVQSIDVPSDSVARGLTVEVLGGAYLRLATTNALPFPISIEYTISDGVSSATSSVSVVPIPELSTHQSPIARDDRVTVRAGDTATVDVLVNDLHPDGVRMTLNPELVEGFADDVDGVAFASGGELRVQAPNEPGIYSLIYRVDDAFFEYATARVLLTVTSADGEGNSAPLPPTVTARVQAGSELTVDIPTSGVDIDGDSVMLLSVTGATMGQIGSTGLSSFQYRAGREAAGTEVIRYTVEDAFGARGSGEVRIGVIPPPEIPLPPVAVDDVAEVRPGDTVIVRVLGNDSDPANSAITLDPQLIEVQDGIAAEVLEKRLVAVTAGEDEGVFVARYGITNAQGGAADAFIKVTVTPDAQPQAPIAEDVVLTVVDILGVEEVDVDLLEGAFNPDGAVDELEAAIVGPGAASVADLQSGSASITLTERRQSIAFTLTSPDTGLAATAFVVVPAATSALPPYLKPEVEDSPPALAVGTTTTLNIRDLVEVPSGGELVIVRDESSAGTSQTGGVSNSGVVSATSGLDQVTELTDTELRVTPTDDQRGSAQSITVIVTDGITDIDGGTPIEIPLIVGDPGSRDVAPTFTPFEVRIEADGSTAQRDLRAATSHPNADILDAIQYEAVFSGATGAFRVDVSGGVLTASAPLGGAQPGDEILVDLTIQADELLTEPVTAQVAVQVVPSTRPLAQAINDDEPDGRSSSTYGFSPLENDFNPFAAIGGDLAVVDAEIDGDPLGASIDFTSTTVTVQTGPAKSGTVSVLYTVQDASNEESRQVQGRITVVVTSAPEPPTWSGAPARSGSGALAATFDPPSSWNGSPESNPPYAVTAYLAGSSSVVATRTDCLAGAPCQFSGLTNGTAYDFIVVASNDVGGTASARSMSATPFATPTAPSSVTLSPANAYAPASLSASWTGGSTGGGSTANQTLWFNWRYVEGSSATNQSRVYANSGAAIQANNPGTFQVQVQACNPAGCSSGWTSSNTATVSNPVWTVQVDAADTCAQRNGSAAGMPGCAEPVNTWIPANTNLTVTCHVEWNLTVLGDYPSTWYYISSGPYSGYYVAQRTLRAPWDPAGYVPSGMPSC